MDHRISKDMISSGMTPSGQRSQQDLSRSQYGSAATPSSLAEAYKKISEMKGPALPGEPNRPGTPKAPGGRPHLPGEKPTPKPGLRLAGADLFDIVKGHLMSEGLSEEDALKKMIKMTEEEKTEIAEAYAQISEKKKDDSYLETDMKKRQENNEKARKEMAKVKGQKNPHFEQYTVTNADKKGNTPAYQNYKKGMKSKIDGKPLYTAAPHLKGV